jgi:16S rRNA G527 N7-methylase RsmG
MDIFSIDVTPAEIAFIRQSLDLVQISGKDAKFLAGLQIKLESEYAQIQEMKVQEEKKKQEELEVVKTKEKK